MSCDVTCSGPDIYYIGDIGAAIVVDVCNDIATATLVALDVTKPDGTQVRWVGSLHETTKIKYIVIAGDFDQAGEYRVQAYIEIPGWSGHGNTTTFKVADLFQ